VCRTLADGDNTFGGASPVDAVLSKRTSAAIGPFYGDQALRGGYPLCFGMAGRDRHLALATTRRSPDVGSAPYGTTVVFGAFQQPVGICWVKSSAEKLRGGESGIVVVPCTSAVGRAADAAVVGID